MAYIQPLGDLYTYTFIKQGIEMKPFDLEAAKRGEPIVTRDGREAKFIAHVPEARPSYRTVVLIGGETFSLWDSGYYWESTRNSPNDIFMAPKKKTVWVNFVRENGYISSYCHASEVEANISLAYYKRISGKAYPVEIEE